MAYTFPQNGGLQYTQGGKTVGVFFNDTPLGPVLIVGEKVDGQWLGRWNKGPQQEADWNAQINAAGGELAFIRLLFAVMSAVIKNLFGGSGPVPATFTEKMNAMLAAGFKIDATGISDK